MVLHSNIYNSFNRNDFLLNRNKVSIENSFIILKGLIKKSNILNNFIIEDVSSWENIKENSILFLEKEVILPDINFSNIFLITNNEDTFNKFSKKNIFLVSDFNNSYKKLINYIYIHEDSNDFIDDFSKIDGSYISKYSSVHESAKIFKNCVIGRGVQIGKNCIIKNNCVIKNTIIKDNVTIGDNCTIGSTGFGFDLKSPGAKNIIPQIGIVFLDENTHIGSNCTIDRGKIDITYIGKNSMIDNLVHIAHNVILGENACLAAQSGISGSTLIGKNLICGGQSGFAGHLKIGNNVIVAGKSGVTKNISDKSIVAGFPATDINKWKKIIINQRKNGHK